MAAEDSLRFHPEVVSDLREAIGWYSEISQDLANDFRQVIDASLGRLVANPELYPHAFDDVRFVRVRTFPYLVLYKNMNEVPFVLGIFHGASDPSKWRQRASS